MAKKQSYLGIDLGGTSIKVVELKDAGGRPQLVTYGFIDEAYNIVKDESQEARQAIAANLKELLKKTKVTSDRAIAALPSFSVFSSVISLPAMSKKDLISAIRWEAKKFVPIPLEEMILDWEILKDLGIEVKPEEPKKPKEEEEEEKKKEFSSAKATEDRKEDKNKDTDKKEKKSDKKGTAGKGNIKVLLTAAPKNLVNRYVELFKEIGLQLVGLETESFALERSLVGNDRNPVMAIDIGNRATSVMIFSEGVPIHYRGIDVGGNSITKSLVETMGLTAEQAEQFKRDMGVSVTEETIDKLPQPVRYVINSIVNEIRYILNIYQSQNKKPITKVILTGGSSFLANLTNYIQNIFNIKAYIGDPWARVIHPVEIDSFLKELGPRLSVAIGLAMREIV